MFDPRLLYNDRQQRLLEEARHDHLAASLTPRRERDHPVLGGLLMSVGAALLTAGLRMNMRRLLAAEGISGGIPGPSGTGPSGDDDIAYIRELFTVNVAQLERPDPTDAHSPARLADCA